MNILLDTNILIHLSRNPERKLLNKIANPSNRKIFISVVTLGELKSIGIQNVWGEKRWERINDVLQVAALIEIGEDLLETYAQIDSFSQRKNPFFEKYYFDTSRNMGKNDLWIASTAALLGLTLVTTDADFDHLHDIFLDVLRITPETLLP